MTLLASAEDAFEKGDRRIDLGPGRQLYKLRFASDDAPIFWTGIIPRTRRYLLTRIRLAPDQAHGSATRIARTLPPQWRRRIKRLIRRS
jgi:hypothetical protein